MAQLQTQLLQNQDGAWLDTTNVFLKKVNIFEYPAPTVGWAFREFPGYSGSAATTDLFLQVTDGLLTIPNPISGSDTFNITTGIYTFADGQPNRFQTATIGGNPTPTPTPSTDIDLNSGFFETDLQTNITKYFAESFKLKASDFELVNGVVQINPEKLASITVDLTHIVNTSVETQNLTATNATLGTATANSMTASDITASDITATNSTLGDAKADTIEVENDGLIIKDPAGNKHKFGFTA